MDEIRNKNITNKELMDFNIYLNSDKDEKTIIEERRIKRLEKQGIIKYGDVYYSKIDRELYQKRKIYDPFKLPKFFYEIEYHTKKVNKYKKFLFNLYKKISL